MSRQVALAGVAGLVVAGALAVGSGLVGAAPGAQREPLAAAIYEGSCLRPGEEAVHRLTEPAKPTGETVRGLPFVSETRLEAALPALQSERYAIVINSGDGPPKAGVACGDLNAVTTEDGSTMLVGLFEQNASLYTGVAALSADGEGTTVRLYLARGLNGGYGVSSGASADDLPGDDEVTTTVTVTVTDDAIEADTSEVTVGSTVEFRVTNAGEDRHEVVLEERGAEEEPLEGDDDAQAETEDLAPEEEATFVHTFEDSGAFQLADHIGENYENGLVAEIIAR